MNLMKCSRHQKQHFRQHSRKRVKALWAPATKTEERAAPLFTMYIHYSSKDWVGKILGKMLLKECLLRLYLFDQKYKYLLKCNLFLWWQSWIFSIITPVSHDFSENILICWFGAQKQFLIIIIFETVVLIFLWKL